jgi:hypothetical protein
VVAVADEQLQMPERHEPVNVTEAMAEAARPADERISRPANTAAVKVIAKRQSVERSG